MKGSIRMNTGFAIACSVLIFLSGGIVGAFIGARNQKRTYERTLKQARDQNERLEEALDRASSGRRQQLQQREEEVDRQLETIGKRPYTPPPRTEYSKIQRRKNPDLMELAAKYGDPSSDDEFMPQRSVSDYLLEREGPRDDRPLRAPFQISAEDFELESASTNTSVLSYYKEDGALVDERDVIILDPDSVVGEDGMEALADTAEDILYFHNEALDLNFEVDVRHGMNYRRDILGAIDEPIREEDEDDEEVEEDGVGEFDTEEFNPRHP